MGEKIDLRQMERQAFTSFHGDGLLDFCLGGAIIQLGIFFFFLPEIFAGVLGSTIWWLFLYFVLKKAVTIPRMGFVQFSPNRQLKTWILIIVIAVIINGTILSVLLILLFIPNIMPILEVNFVLILGLAGFLAFLIAGYFSAIRRFYVYGIITGTVFCGSLILGFPFYMSLFSLGIVVLSTGLVLLSQFLRRYPKQRTGEVLGV